MSIFFFSIKNLRFALILLKLHELW